MGIINVSVFGFTTALGSVANLADGNEATFWAPYADGFDGYTQPAVGDAGFVIADGSPRPAIQFDFIDRVRIPIFRTKVEAPKSIGEGWLICSDSPATSVNDTVQAGDLNAGFFTIPQMNGVLAVETLAKTQNIRGRYWRFVFWKQPPIS